MAWGLGTLCIIAAYPAYVEAYLLTAADAVAGYLAFRQIRHRRDPRAFFDWLLPLFLATVVVLQYRHAGYMAPIVVTMPIVVATSVLYQRGIRRILTCVGCFAVFIYCTISAMGLIGYLLPILPQTRALLMLFSLIVTSLGLGVIAWISTLSRDHVLDRLRLDNDSINENASRTRIALEAARVGLWDIPDAELPQFHVSESFQSITGYSGPEFNDLFGNLDRFVHADDVAALREAFARGREKLSRIRVDFRLMTRARGYRWFSARARYLRNSDGTIRISGSLQDINFIKVAEEALRTGRDQARAADKAKSDFIAVMSHEVRTPLNAILGSVQVLKGRQHDAESAEMIGLIQEAGNGLLAIVNDLLDVSRIDAGKLEIAPVVTDLPALVRRTVDFWGPQAAVKGLSLSVECPDAANLPPLLLDAGRVRQVVGNLISNAIKFTDTGGVKTSISFTETADRRIETWISVIDTGPGVAPAVADAIFAPFEQGPGNASRGGAGLGLFISRRLARMMGGDLTLVPTRGKGAHFRLNLIADQADPAAAPASASPPHAGWHGIRILCVDDNENNRRIVELLLGKLGFDLTLCASGSEALDLCAIQAFDLILMDIVMPDMDGKETLRRLRDDADSLNRATPAIALTAKLSHDDFAAYREAGFEGVSPKPIDLADLAGEIARITIPRTAAKA